jgi:hypothetical protein
MRVTMVRGRCAAGVAAAVLALGWIGAGAGIIELGVKGQRAGGSEFRAVVDGHTFTDPGHAPGDLAEDILERIRAVIDADSRYTATREDPNHPTRNAIRVVRQSSGAEVRRLGVFEDDPNIKGGVAHLDNSDIPQMTLFFDPIDAVAGNGSVNLEIQLAGGTMTSHLVSTASGDPDVVNALLAADLAADGYLVQTPPNRPFIIRKPGVRIVKAVYTYTDTGVKVSGVTLGPHDTSAIPALTPWGLAALVAVMAAAALWLLRRRRARSTA